MTRTLVRALSAEAIGPFALVLAGAGAIMVNAKSEELGQVGIALSFGLVVMVMIYAFGNISGAHFNPAVSLAFALSRHFAWPRVLAYWAAQCAGAITAACLLRASLGAALGAAAYQVVRGERVRPADLDLTVEEKAA